MNSRLGVKIARLNIPSFIVQLKSSRTDRIVTPRGADLNGILPPLALIGSFRSEGGTISRRDF